MTALADPDATFELVVLRFRLNWDSLTNGVTNNLMKTVEKAFYMFDVDKSGTISQWELQMVMR